MRSFTSIARTSTAALLATLVANVAGAADFGAATSPVYSIAMPIAADVGTMVLDAGGQPVGVQGIGQALDSTALEDLRGGEVNLDQEVEILGQVNGNTADRIISGTNSISEGAFGNAAGINTVIQNSGSNVLIQNGMNVNVQFVDPAL